MKRRIPISAAQSAAFAMGRALLVFETWTKSADEALDVERAMLIDFAVQHPRSLRELVPELDLVVRGHGLQKNDLSDAFAERHFGVMRERFMGVIGDLLARNLLEEIQTSDGTDRMIMKLTTQGLGVAHTFSSALSYGIRALCEVLVEVWRRRNVRDLAADIRRTLPDEAGFAAGLRESFAQWVEAD